MTDSGHDETNIVVKGEALGARFDREVEGRP